MRAITISNNSFTWFLSLVRRTKANCYACVHEISVFNNYNTGRGRITDYLNQSLPPCIKHDGLQVMKQAEYQRAYIRVVYKTAYTYLQQQAECKRVYDRIHDWTTQWSYTPTIKLLHHWSAYFTWDTDNYLNTQNYIHSRCFHHNLINNGHAYVKLHSLQLVARPSQSV